MSNNLQIEDAMMQETSMTGTKTTPPVKTSLNVEDLKKLATNLKGVLHYDTMMRTLYATDASVYRELPQAVAFPKSTQDLKTLIQFATKHKTSLIPRTAGTSLAGQCVGHGIVVDVSKNFTEIIELNAQEKWVRVQPGVVRDELNKYLLPHGLMFGPNTSTSNRCMIGGMVGNNSCGTTSIKYGNTRDHVLELNVLLSDGSEVTVKDLNTTDFKQKCEGTTLESKIYQCINEILSDHDNQCEIINEFPKEEVTRRNTGYALDELLFSELFDDEDAPAFNLCKLLTGSEGTLSFTTEIKLNLVPLPPKEKAVICTHFHDLDSSLRATVIAMQHAPFAVELMDDNILDCTKGQLQYEKYRFFIEGEPKAVLCVELKADTKTELDALVQKLIDDYKENKLGYSHPIVYGEDIDKVWGIRKAGLGLLSNIPGDAKAVAVVEDTAVAVEDLPAYIKDFKAMLAGFNTESVYYAHAGAGELHMRPLLDLKKKEDRKRFRDIGRATAELVKKYEGANSGEHGDGRVRGEFLELLVGKVNYQLFKKVKQTFDPNNIFNPGKIVDAPPINEDLRYDEDQKTKSFDTKMDFSDTDGILRMLEKCTGSGDCRKTHLIGGTMCPSYMATRNERDTTRARANILREFLTRSNDANPFAHEEVKEVMSLCMSCKGCKSECPSNVDMATLKAEYQYQYYKKHGVPQRAKLFANITDLHKKGSILPSINNLGISLFGGMMKKRFGIAEERSIPHLYKTTLTKWFKKNYKKIKPKSPKSKVYFFNDEFTNYLDTPVGMKAIELLCKLGYEVEIPEHVESGRAQLSKGLLDEAQKLARKNVSLLKNKVTENTPIVGVEPSAILGFRDEYIRLVEKSNMEAAKALGKNALTIEEFLWKEVEKGNISPSDFSTNSKTVLLHGHCHQKALSSVNYTAWLLALPENYNVEVIPSGCCGMAGSFGYEAENYKVSMEVGELVLFPAVRESNRDTIIAAPGTSCRHQIHDGTKRKSQHPVEVLFDALV